MHRQAGSTTILKKFGRDRKIWPITKNRNSHHLKITPGRTTKKRVFLLHGRSNASRPGQKHAGFRCRFAWYSKQRDGQVMAETFTTAPGSSNLLILTPNDTSPSVRPQQRKIYPVDPTTTTTTAVDGSFCQEQRLVLPLKQEAWSTVKPRMQASMGTPTLQRFNSPPFPAST